MRGKVFQWGDGQVENLRRVELGSAALVLASREEKGVSWRDARGSNLRRV